MTYSPLVAITMGDAAGIGRRNHYEEFWAIATSARAAARW